MHNARDPVYARPMREGVRQRAGQVLEVGLVVVVVMVATGVGFQLTYGATPAFWLIVGIPTLILAAYASYGLGRDGELSELMRPAWGDLTRAVLGTALLYALAYAFVRIVTPPGSGRDAWLMRVYLQFGDPHEMQAHLGVVALSILAICAAEEIVWRGFVTRALSEIAGSRRGWIYASLLYAFAHGPTMWALSDGRLGPNPVVVIAALGGGLVWGGMARAYGSLPPVILAHAAFDYCAIVSRDLRLWGPPL